MGFPGQKSTPDLFCACAALKDDHSLPEWSIFCDVRCDAFSRVFGKGVSVKGFFGGTCLVFQGTFPRDERSLHSKAVPLGNALSGTPFPSARLSGHWYTHTHSIIRPKMTTLLRSGRGTVRKCTGPKWSKMVQNGQNDHFGKKWPYCELDSSKSRDQNGPFWSSLA